MGDGRMPQNDSAERFQREFNQRLGELEIWLNGQTDDRLLMYLLAMLRLEIACRLEGIRSDDPRAEALARKLISR
jgi:hypothetical protein